ncbi:hypothetical protein K8352_10875 [Flavobacteriaceae bacterium F89]|uniref:Uncharacterized protein n=1 Tax=Cerina litoralis TaxID=2874477 RepID=A0AAE3EVT4_9FLAO|nr:hypothetical protein [Cerina litoralis]MCG2461253.1 hypothetical protein [Cerina litoralis]
MKKKYIAIYATSVTVFLLSILCFSCKAQKKGGAEENKVARDSILTLVLCNDYGGSVIQEIQLIKDEKTLQRAFAKINMARKPGLPVPKLDFKKEIAILASRGEAKGSSQIRLKLNSETSERLVFWFKKSQISESSAITTPFCLYKMPFTQKEVIFKEK